MTCCICLDEENKGMFSLACKHKLCCDCYEHLLAHSNKMKKDTICPLCRHVQTIFIQKQNSDQIEITLGDVYFIPISNPTLTTYTEQGVGYCCILAIMLLVFIAIVNIFKDIL